MPIFTSLKPTKKTENTYLLIARAAVNTLSRKHIAAAVDRVQYVRH